MDVLNTVQNFIVENFLFDEKGNLNEDTALLESGIIDSTGILELVNFIEETYDFKIENDELLPENMNSLNKIEQFIQRKVNR
jgi:acyl carrier protein